jgi:hypothetical protein
MSDIEEDNSDLAIINDETINWVEVVTRRLFAKSAASASAFASASASASSSAAASKPEKVRKFKDYFESTLNPVGGNAGIYRLVYGEYALDEQTIGYAQTKTKEIERRLVQFNMPPAQPVDHREVLFFEAARNAQEFKDKKLMYRLKLRPLCLNLCFIPQLNGNFDKIKTAKSKLIGDVGKNVGFIKSDIDLSGILLEHTKIIFGYIETVNKGVFGDKVDQKFKSELLYNCVVKNDTEKEASQQVIYGTQISLVLQLNTDLVERIIESFGDTDEKIVQDFSQLPETIELVTTEFAYSPVMSASFSNYMKGNKLNLDGILLLSSMRYNRDKSRLEFLRSIYSKLRGVDSVGLPDILFNIHHSWFTVAFLDPFKLELTIEKKIGIDPDQKRRMIIEEKSRRRYAKEFYTAKSSQLFLDILNIYGAKICDAPPLSPEEEPPGPDDDNSYVPNDDGSNGNFTKVGMSLKDWFKSFNSQIILDSHGGGNGNNDLPSLRQIINLLLVLLQDSVSTQGMRVECVGGDSHKRWAWGILTETTADIDAKLYYTRTSSKSETIIDKLIFILQFLTIFFEQNDYFKFKRTINVKFGSRILKIVIDSTKQERMCSFRALFNWVVDILSLDVKISYKIYDDDNGTLIASSKYLSSPLDIVLKKVDQKTIDKKNNDVEDPSPPVLETDLEDFFPRLLPAPAVQQFIGVRYTGDDGQSYYKLRPTMGLQYAAEDIGLLVSPKHRAERVAVGKSGKDDERNAAIKFAVLIFQHLKQYNFVAEDTKDADKKVIELELTPIMMTQLQELEDFYKIPKQVKRLKTSSFMLFDRYKKVVERFIDELRENLYKNLQQFEREDGDMLKHYLFLQNVIDLVLKYNKTFCFRTAHDFYFDLSLYTDLQVVVSQYMNTAPSFSLFSASVSPQVNPKQYTLVNMTGPLKLESIFSLSAYSRESIDTNKRYISPLSHNSFQDHIERGVDTITNQLHAQQQLYKTRKGEWGLWLENPVMLRGGSNVTNMQIEYIDEPSGDNLVGGGDNVNDIPIEINVEID